MYSADEADVSCTQFFHPSIALSSLSESTISYMKQHYLPAHLWGQVAEIQVAYQNPVPSSERIKIQSSQHVYDVLLAYWERETMDFKEHFVVMYLNRANEILGLHRLSSGGIAGVVVDTKHVIAIALKANASSIILAHNHPSGALRPSEADRAITRKIRAAAKLLDLQVFDHLILTRHNYYSFADEGELY